MSDKLSFIIALRAQSFICHTCASHNKILSKDRLGHGGRHHLTNCRHKFTGKYHGHSDEEGFIVCCTFSVIFFGSGKSSSTRPILTGRRWSLPGGANDILGRDSIGTRTSLSAIASALRLLLRGLVRGRVDPSLAAAAAMDVLS